LRFSRSGQDRANIPSRKNSNALSPWLWIPGPSPVVVPRQGRFYDKQAWRDLRVLVLRRDHYRCVRCHAYVGGKGAARVDHIEPVKAAPHRALDITNLRTLCGTCDYRSHSEKSAHDKTKRVDRIVHGHDASGFPRDAGHPWSSYPGGRSQNPKAEAPQAFGAVAAINGDKLRSRQ